MTTAAPPRPALDGIRVIELTTSTAGQTAGMLLADLGADVVRLLDAPVADDIARTGRPGWLCWNRGKRLAGPLSHSDRDVDRLLRRADVLLVDLGPRARAAARLDAGRLRERFPSLVSVWMPPIAARGRWSELPHDQLLLDAIGGFAAHHPATTERPVASVVATRHVVQGALAAVAALSGLLGRRRHGWGRSATVTGLHAEAATLNTLVSRSVDGPPVVSPGKLLPGPPNFRLYQAGDGAWLYLAALSPDLFITALGVLDRLQLLAHPDVAGEFLNVIRPDVGAMVGAELDRAFATASADEWLARFADAGVPAVAVGDPRGFLDGDVLAHACPPVVAQHPELGRVMAPGTPVTLDANPPSPGPLPRAELLDPADIWSGPAETRHPDGDPPGPDDRPLAGVRVIDLATFLAAPFVGTLMAAHGADVVKVEAPAGDPYAVFSASYAIVNEHKPRLVVDLRDPAGRSELLRLVERADVVVDNLVASSLARLELTPDTLAAANPTLVRCSVTAYGTEGPYAERPGFDPILQTLSGLVAVQGGAGRPVATTAPVHDVAAGCTAAVGVLAALWVRERDGHGQRVFTSLAANSAFLQAGDLTVYDGRPERPLGGPDFVGPNSAQRFYQAADRWIAVAAVDDHQRAALFDAVGHPELADVADVADAERAEVVASVIVSTPAEFWLERLAAARVPACAAINRVELDDSFLVENDYSHVVATPHVGRIEVVGGYTEWADHARLPPLPVDRQTTDHEAVLRRWQR